MIMIYGHSAKENGLRQRIKDLENEVVALQVRSSKREAQLMAEKAELIRRHEEEKHNLLD